MASTDTRPNPTSEIHKIQIDELKQIQVDLEKLKSELTILKTKYDRGLSDYETKLQQLSLVSDKICQEQDEKEMNSLNATAEWLEIKAKLELNNVLPNQKVKLNVGGAYFETTIETLTKYSEGTTSYFKALFSRQWVIEKDPKDESIFIDRDGVFFNYILQYLRTGRLSIDPNDSILRQDLITEAEFYKIESLVKLLKMNDTSPQQPNLEPKKLCFDTKILSYEHQKQLNKLFGSENQQWKLIYRASRDGYSAKGFHQLCDGCFPTMTVIRSKNGYIFGGFTIIPWSSATEDKTDKSAFLFTLTNPHNIKPTKYPIYEQLARFAVSHKMTNGPTFGSIENGGSDIHLQDPFNVAGSRIFFSRTYKDTTARGWCTFTGDSHFSCDNIEIFIPT